MTFDSELIKDEFTNLYHKIIKIDFWYVKYKQSENKLLDLFFQQIESESWNPDGDHYKELISCLIIFMKFVKTDIK